MNTLEEYLDYNDFYDSDIDLMSELPTDNDDTDLSDLYEGNYQDTSLDSIEDLYDDGLLDLNLDDLLYELLEDSTDNIEELPETEINDDIPLTDDASPDIDDLELDIETSSDLIDNDTLDDLDNVDVDDDYSSEDIDELVDLYEQIDDIHIEDDNVNQDTQEDITSLSDELSIEDFDIPQENLELPEVIPKIRKSKYKISYPVETCVLKKEEQLCDPCFRKYDINTDTVGYQLRGNNHTLPVTHKLYSFKLLFTSADGTKYVPASITQSINGISKCIANQTPINPFGEILLYNGLKPIEAGQRPPANNLWTLCAVTLGYSFNNTGKQLRLTKWSPLYVVCLPNEDGSAVIDIDNPYALKLPSEADGKIYIYLGIVYNDTLIELDNNHVVYYNDGTGIRVWTGKDCYTKLEIDAALNEKQDALVSGINIKTINYETLIGSGNINIDEAEALDNYEITSIWQGY